MKVKGLEVVVPWEEVAACSYSSCQSQVVKTEEVVANTKVEVES